jgi:hypothetical protein
MGNYSYWQNEETELLDEKKYRELLQKYWDLKKEEIDGCIKDKEYFMFADGWKIQGYWYPEFCKFLLDMIGVIKGTVAFQEEQGYNFWIIFDDEKVEIEEVPMKTEVVGMDWIIKNAELTKKEKETLKTKLTVLKL